MKYPENIGRAKMLLETYPKKAIWPRDYIPWVMRVLVFLLRRYIDGK